MRHIVLSDDGYNVAHNAYHRLLAVGYFPESPRDQEQGLLIAALEQAEFDRVGQATYRPSEIMKAASHLVEKRTAQIYLAGFVALTFIWLKATGQTLSLNRAALIASCAANEFGTINWRRGLDPTGKDKDTPVTSDHSTVEQIFRKYRSVAHICAANISASEYLEVLHLWDQTPEVIGSMIQTCASFQVALEGATDVSDWNIWDIKKHFPACLDDWPVLVPGDNLLAWINRGYTVAVAEGLIVR